MPRTSGAEPPEEHGPWASSPCGAGGNDIVCQDNIQMSHARVWGHQLSGVMWPAQEPTGRLISLLFS